MSDFDNILQSDHVDFEVGVESPPLSQSDLRTRTESPGGSGGPEGQSSQAKPDRQPARHHRVRSKAERQGRRMDPPQRRDSSDKNVSNLVESAAKRTAEVVVGELGGRAERAAAERRPESAEQVAALTHQVTALTEQVAALGEQVEKSTQASQAAEGKAGEVVGKVEEGTGKVVEKADLMAGKADSAVGKAEEATDKAGRVVQLDQDALAGKVAERVKSDDDDATEQSKSWLGRKVKAVKEISKGIQSSAILTAGLVGSGFIDNPDVKHSVIAGAVGLAGAAVASGEVMRRKHAKKQEEAKQEETKPEENKQE